MFQFAVLTITTKLNTSKRERILAELVQHYILAGRYRDALDELELYVSSSIEKTTI